LQRRGPLGAAGPARLPSAPRSGQLCALQALRSAGLPGLSAFRRCRHALRGLRERALTAAGVGPARNAMGGGMGSRQPVVTYTVMGLSVLFYLGQVLAPSVMYQLLMFVPFR